MGNPFWPYGYPGFGAAPAQLPTPQVAAPAPGAGPMPGIQQTPAVPPDWDPRLGAVQVLQKEIYDTILYGVGQSWSEHGEELFTVVDRINNEYLCSLKEVGRFSDKRTFRAYQIGLTLEFTNPDLYELFHYNLIKYGSQDATKFWVWADRLAAGGGVGGVTDQGTGNFHLNWGDPDPRAMYALTEPLDFSLDRTFVWKSSFMLLEGVLAAAQPRAVLNADEESRKLYRFIMVGKETGDVGNR